MLFELGRGRRICLRECLAEGFAVCLAELALHCAIIPAPNI